MDRRSQPYTLIDKIGGGSFGEVHLATDAHNRKYAIKRMEISSIGFPHLNELATLTTFDNHYIQNITDHYIDQELGVNYINLVMDLADSDLKGVMSKSSKSIYESNPTLAIKWCNQLLQAVSVLHAQGFVHCDIKTSNILVYGDNIKLADFSLIKRKDGQNITGKCGTASSRSPEMWTGKDCDEKVDIWSVGYVIYEILTGERAYYYRGKTGVRKNYLKAIADFVAKRTIDELKLPAECKNLLRGLLSYSAGKRLSAAQALKLPIFKGFSRPNYLFNSMVSENPKNGPDIRRKIREFNENKYTQELTFHIYCICHTLVTGYSLNQLLGGCYFVALKLRNSPMAWLPDKITKLIEIEREICAKTNFRFYHQL